MVLLALIGIPVGRALSFDAPDEFLRQKGELSGASLELVAGDSAYEAYQLTLTSTAGYHVRGFLRVPRGPRPTG